MQMAGSVKVSTVCLVAIYYFETAWKILENDVIKWQLIHTFHQEFGKWRHRRATDSHGSPNKYSLLVPILIMIN